ncbi:MAG: hypothetical protein R3E32_11545 [Chitinophagales bacterium]
MTRPILFIAVICLILSGCRSHNAISLLEKKSTINPSIENFYLGGIHVNVYDMDNWLNTLKEVGMNTVEVTVYGKQWYWDTDSLTFDEDKDTEGQIMEIRAAKKKGLKVVVVLRTQLQHWVEKNHFLWHGMIMPKNDSLLLSWFEKYNEYSLKWAKICEQEGVDVLVIGSEMNALASTVPITSMPWLYGYYNSWFRMSFNERRILKYKKTLQDKKLWVQGFNLDKNGKYWLENYVDGRITAFKHWGKQVTFADQKQPLKEMNKRRTLIKQSWINLIQKVRTVYQGKLTYAANYDNYQEVDFWEHLDFIGINAYFPLRNPTNELPASAELLENFEEKWRNVFKEINTFKKKQHLSDKPLLFTELGYTNYLNATVESWSGQGFTLLGWGLNEKLVIWEEQQICGEERYWAVEALRKVTEAYATNLQGILYWKLTDHEYYLKEESFALHIQVPPKDNLQVALTKFLRKEHITE